MVYDAVDGFYRSLPRGLMRLYGELRFRAGSRHGVRELAFESQQRWYVGDWVCQVVEEGGYEWGVYNVECGIWKFFRQQGAEEFVPLSVPARFLGHRVV